LNIKNIHELPPKDFFMATDEFIDVEQTATGLGYAVPVIVQKRLVQDTNILGLLDTLLTYMKSKDVKMKHEHNMFPILQFPYPTIDDMDNEMSAYFVMADIDKKIHRLIVITRDEAED
jgi:hypothetical protein